MAIKTAQVEKWMSEFGREYTDRNSLTPERLDALYQKNYGITRSQLNQRFLAGIPTDARPEVGCNIGNQLLALQQMGFRNLYGIEIQHCALKRAHSHLPKACLVLATAFDIPYRDGYFDLVFTSGVLIHIAPGDLPKPVAEIHRCSNHYIWGLEYYSPQLAEINYRGHEGLLWKMDYANFYLTQFDDLQLLRTESLSYLESANVDCMFLLRKKKGRG